MLFCSQAYLLFFLAVFAAYWALPWARARVYLLLAASIYFYASWNRWLALLVCASTLADYLLARGMDAARAPRVRKLLLAASLVGNLGLLAYFKYANFFLQSVEEALRAVGREASLPVLQVILPVGISFYTFEAINYTVDVYRRRLPAERDLANFLLFILFFPHLVAGPIVRARDFLPQTRRPKRWDWMRARLGAELVVLGLFKKLAVADRMAQFVDPVFADPTPYGTFATAVAVVAYALQIYCDFSGYTDMAIGCAHLLGYKLAPNFATPYFARNVSEFWRRWHISLSGWLRDYLFIPLGGSRGTRWQTARNLMATMTLGGLWHGASWTFVAWGVLHGALLVAHRAFRDFVARRAWLTRALLSPAGVVLSAGTTFGCVCLAWVFFRAPTFGVAAQVLGRFVHYRHGLGTPLPVQGFLVTLAVVFLAHAAARSGALKRWGPRLPAPAAGLGYAAAVALALLLAPDSGKAFIYFQF